MKQLTVIVPFYNEEKYLAESVSRLLAEKVIENIILVNDSSTDDSLKIAEEIKNSNNNITVLSTTTNLGKGNAIKEALPFVSTSHIIVHDADLEYFPKDIPEMFQVAINNSNCLVLGSRTIGDKKRTMFYKKTYYGQKIFAALFSLLNNKKISDIASCYWLIETKNLQSMNLTQKGFSIEVEVLSKSIKKEMKIIEVPIHYEARSYEDGKKINFMDGINILSKIIIFSKVVSFFDIRQVLKRGK